MTDSKNLTAPQGKLRSRAWFDNPANADMTALYLERYMNFGLSQAELQSDRPIIGIAQTGPTFRLAIATTSNWRTAFVKVSAKRAALPSSSRFIRFRKPASARLPVSTVTLPISASSKCCMAIRSMASF